MNPIKAVLFDFGGVFTLSPFGSVEELARERGVDPLVFAELIFGPYHLDTDHPWHRLERGEISLESTREAILASARVEGYTLDLWDVLGKMAQANGGQMVHEQVVQLLREVKATGFYTAIVTNNVREFNNAWQAMIPMDQVDVVVDSAFVGVRKPNPAIYNAAICQLSEHHGIVLRPDNCVFLDDVESNVKSAEGMGIRGIRVTNNPEETVRGLWSMLMHGGQVTSAP